MEWNRERKCIFIAKLSSFGFGETWREKKVKYIFIFWKEFFFRMVGYENLHVTKMNVNITSGERTAT